jgi:hypothetical protein
MPPQLANGPCTAPLHRLPTPRRRWLCSCRDEVVAELKGDLAAAMGREADLQARLCADAQAVVAETSARQAAERAVQQVRHCDQVPVHSLRSRPACRQHTHACTKLPRARSAVANGASVIAMNDIIHTAPELAE